MNTVDRDYFIALLSIAGHLAQSELTPGEREYFFEKLKTEVERISNPLLSAGTK